MKETIILIGPVRTGKSTIGRLPAARLAVPQVSLDEERWRYYAEIGYTAEQAEALRQAGGIVALVYYWKQFDAYAVERVLAEHTGCVVDFGAGHSVYESTEMLARVEQALAPYPFVILILPSPDLAESLEILNARTADLSGAFGQGFNWHEHFLHHPSNYRLAKHVVYTKGKTAEESCTEILRLIYPES